VIGKVDNTYRISSGEDRYRRGIYTIWRRSATYPAFVNFDATDRSFCTVQRQRSNTPLQALTLLNDESYVEAAAALAKRICHDRTTAPLNQQIAYAFELCLSRAPRTAELEHLTAAFQRELQHYQQTEKARLPAGTNTAGEAAWFSIATILLNLDETITKG
jgi:hypothetical protein